MFGLSVTFREAFTIVHGMVFGFGSLLCFTGGLALLHTLRGDLLTSEGVRVHIRWLKVASVALAVLAWLAVLSGTYVAYPWYRATPPAGTTDLRLFPRSFLLGNPNLSAWHNFAMEWKEHLAWFSPWLATAVAAIVSAYGAHIGRDERLRRALIVLLILAFAIGGVAGVLGALVTKAAPLV